MLSLHFVALSMILSLTPVDGLWENVVSHVRGWLPTALLAAVVLVVGVFCAWLLRRTVVWLARRTGLETFGEKIGVSKLLYAVGARSGLAVFLGQLAFLTGLVLTFSTLAEVVGLPGLAALGPAITSYLPRLLAAGLVLVLGLWVASTLESIVLGLGERTARLAAPKLVSRGVYWAAVVVTVTLAASQAGLDTELVTALLAVVVGATALALGLAFALAARPVFHNLIARPYVESTLRVGDRVRVGDLEGRVERFTSVAVVVRSDAGRHVVPCHRLVEEGYDLPSEPQASR